MHVHSVGLPQFRENTAMLYKGVKMFLIVTAVCPGTKGPIISEDICGFFQLPKKYSVFLSFTCWYLSFEFSRTFLETLSKS